MASEPVPNHPCSPDLHTYTNTLSKIITDIGAYFSCHH